GGGAGRAAGRGGKPRRYEAEIVPGGNAERLMEEYWPLYDEHGMSFVAKYALQIGRDVLLTEAIREWKPKPDELWFVRLLHKHGMRQILYVPSGYRWRAV